VNRRVFKDLSIFETLIIWFLLRLVQSSQLVMSSYPVQQLRLLSLMTAAKPFLILVSHVVVYNIERTEG